MCFLVSLLLSLFILQLLKKFGIRFDKLIVIGIIWLSTSWTFAPEIFFNMMPTETAELIAAFARFETSVSYIESLHTHGALYTVVIQKFFQFII
jgi:hypothetical protein